MTLIKDEDYNCLVLHWIMKKKKGYDLSTNKYPKWFANTYGIDFNAVANNYIANGDLNAEGNIVSVSQVSKETLKRYAYVIYVYEHQQYEISLESFEIFKEAIQNAGTKGIFQLKDVNKKMKWNTPDENSRLYFYASTENKVNRIL